MVTARSISRYSEEHANHHLINCGTLSKEYEALTSVSVKIIYICFILIEPVLIHI